MVRLSFRKRLQRLKEDMECVGQKTIQIHKDGMAVLYDYDKETADKVIAASKEIDDMVFNLEKDTISFIAAEQPVARDLRFIEACIKMGSHFKRISHLSADIVYAAENLNGAEIPKKIKEQLSHMSDIVQLMLSKGIYAFLDKNIDMAKELRHDDDKVDYLFDQILEQVSNSMFDDKETISYMVHILFIARFLERIADRAVSMGDRTIYMISSEKP